MASSIIKIKRSGTAGAPANLGQGELGYSYLAGNLINGGDRLYIGTGAEAYGNAATISPIGGLYYTRLVDASTPGTLETGNSSIPILSATGTIDKWYAGNTYIYSNVITTTDTNSDLILDPNGTGKVKIADTWTLPRGAGTDGYVLKTNGSDTATWTEPKIYIGNSSANLFNTQGSFTTINGFGTLAGGQGNRHYLDVGQESGPILAGLNITSNVQIQTGSNGVAGKYWGFEHDGSTKFPNYTFPAADAPSSGYLLKSDGAGTLSWAQENQTFYLGSTALGNTSATVKSVEGFETLSGGNYGGNYVKVGDIGFGPALGTTNNDSDVRIETGASGTVAHTWLFKKDGTTTFNSAYTFPATDGAANYYLKTDGSGIISWAPASTTLDSVLTAGNSTTQGLTVGNVTTGEIINNGHYWKFNSNGTTTFNNAFTFPASDGTDGYILKTDGNGAISWTSQTAGQLQADYTQTNTASADYIKNKPNLQVYAIAANISTVGYSGDYTDLLNTPLLGNVALSDDYNDLINTPVLSAVATSNDYNDLDNLPSLAAVATSGLYSDLTGTPALGNVALSDDYNDLINRPTLPYYLNLSGDSGTGNVELLMDTIDFVGQGPLNTAISRVGNIVSVTSNVDYATTSDVGVASFSSSNFDVSVGGQVTLKSGGITNASLANANITIGNTTVNLGETTTAFAGLTSVQVGNIKIHNNNTIENPALNGNISLKTNGAGVIDANDTRITNVSDPINAHDVANRSYVDAVAAGLHVHAPAAVAVEGNLATLTGGSVTYYNGVGNDGVDATITLGTAITAIDGQTLGTATLPTNSRILIKDQANKAHNGIYTINAAGTILTRAVDFNTPTLIHGGDFIFVEYGTKYGATGWVQTDITDGVGTSNIEFSQFAGPGTYNAGNGLLLDGTIFNVQVNSTDGGIEISANKIQIKSSTAGNGLTYSAGIYDIGGTADRISVGSNSIDIAATYAGQSSITTLGNVTTGTWYGDVISTTKGGTGYGSFASYDLLVGNGTSGGLSILGLGNHGQFLQVNDAGTALVYADLDGGTY